MKNNIYCHVKSQGQPVSVIVPDACVITIRAEIADAQHGMADAAGMKQFKLVRQKRPARDRHERLGNFLRDGPQPCGQAAGEDGHGNLGKRKIHGIR